MRNMGQKPATLLALVEAANEILSKSDAIQLSESYSFGRTLVEKDPGNLSPDDVAERIAEITGLSSSYIKACRDVAANITVTEILNWMDWADENRFRLSLLHLQELSRLSDPEEREGLAIYCLEDHLTYEQVRTEVEEILAYDEYEQLAALGFHSLEGAMASPRDA